MIKSLVCFIDVSCPKEHAATVMCMVPIAVGRGAPGTSTGCALGKLGWPNDEVLIRRIRI